MDSFSPLAAARVLVQVLPVGPITGPAFDQVVNRLKTTEILSLEQLEVPEDAGRNAFNASSLPKGKLCFHFSSATRLPSTALLYPFETFREPFIILGVADLTQRSWHDRDSATDGSPEHLEQVAEQLAGFAAQLQENYPGALLHRILSIDDKTLTADLGSNVLVVSPEQDLKPVLSDLGGRLIPELGGLAKSFQALQNFSSPLAGSGDQSSGSITPTGLASARRGSLQPDSSVQSADTKASHRMSMPAHLMSGANGDPSTGSATPIASGRASPATTFDDIAGAVSPKVIARMSTPPSKTNKSRDSSADRASTSGFGSSTLNERNRMRQQGRLSCIVGSLYLQAGLWSDALNELSESMAKARSCSDHLWHAKAFENAIIALILLACNGIGFRIPDICYPSSSRPLAARGLQSAAASSSLAQALKPEEVAEAMNALYGMVPDMIHMTQDLYRRTIDVPGEGLTLAAYSEINIRFARLLTKLPDGGGTDETLRQMMHVSQSSKSTSAWGKRRFTRQASELLHSAIPTSSEFTDTSVTETLSIFGAIAASYSALGMARKAALILQDYFDYLTPGLVQARKLGAAEAGMHPAAGIPGLHNIEHGGDAEESHVDILKFFTQVDLLVHDDQTSTDSYLDDASNNIDMRLNLLRKCIRVCEALPNFNGILKCTAELLRLAGPGSAPSLRSADVYIKIAAEEQVMLASNFYRTSDLMDNLGLTKEGGHYWDRFIVRGIELQLPTQQLEMVTRRIDRPANSASEQKSTERGVFLHDAFAIKPAPQRSQAVLVAGESRAFSVMLQNLFDFEVHIDSLELVTSHDDFRPVRHELRLSPHRMQVFKVAGTPQSAGSVRITGCRIKVKGCAATEFGIFPDPWSPPENIKIFHPTSNPAQSSKSQPKPFALDAIVLPRQPWLDLQSSSLSQRALEVYEGETKIFALELHNISKDASVNFFHITTQDNIKSYLLSALKERDLSPPLRYEIEHQLYVEPAVRYGGQLDTQEFTPKQTRLFHIEVLGKPGLSHVSSVFEYAYLADLNMTGQIFTRVLPVPMTVTVKPSLRLASFRIAPLPKDPLEVLPAYETHCWLTLDFQNLSTQALQASIKLNNSEVHDDQDHIELIPPNAIGSISCIIPKLYIEKVHAPIPSLDPFTEQQFVIRTSGGAPIDQRFEREQFWYSTQLIDSVAATWTNPHNSTSGSISLRDIVLSPTEIATLRLDDLSVLWEDEVKGEIAAPSSARIKLINRGNESLSLELQLYRSMSGFVERVAGGHIESQLLSTIEPHSEATAEFGITFNCKGHHVFIPSVIERDHVQNGFDRQPRTWHGEPKYVTIA